jgi:superfamily II DNA or RNA helicase
MNSLWQYCSIHKSACKLIEEQTLWGQNVCHVWLPNQDTVVRVPRSALRPLSADLQPEFEAERIAYVAAAAKVAEVLEGSSSPTDEHVLLAPMESNVIPLPHQIHALSRAISGDRVRYLLADEVGLGKTIEAGLIMRELKLRGLVRRILVVAPKGLATQWVAEMQTHFNEEFQLILGDDIATLQRLTPGRSQRDSAWSIHTQVIVSLDSVKPIDKRRGWTAERIAEYNRLRFEDIITAGWDLVVVDEAHRLGGSTDQVARYKLGKGLTEAAPSVLLLSATPHQGKTDAFHRLMTLLDEDAFPDIESVSRDRVLPYVIRTEKRKAIDAEGKPLFKARRTQTAPIVWESRHQLQQALYEAVTEYVREGYNQAQVDKKRHIGFLMILMQRLVVSSTRAICTTLERRLTALKEGEHQASQRLAALESDAESSESIDELYDMDAQELLDELLKSQVSALLNERSQVEALLDAATRCEQAGADAKAEALIEWIYKLQAEENEHDMKVLIFTEFVPTQQMLREFLEERAISVATLNGSMDMEERKKAQDAFRSSHRVLVSTDAGGEGLNLQFAHVIINYDLPWNPMRLEQRIGRVDRIGQPKTVRAINFVFEDTVEFRVREVLEQKLAIIFEEFGIDKTGDVLDSAQAGELFEGVFAQAVVNPQCIEQTIDKTLAHVRKEIQQARESSALYGISDEPDSAAAERLRSHPLPHWVERMTVGYLKAHGGMATSKRSWWDLRWPDGEEHRKAVFLAREADRLTGATLLNLENARIRGLAQNIPQITLGQPIPNIEIADLPSAISGYWGLFEIRLLANMIHNNEFLHLPVLRRGYVAVFINDAGKLFLPTARHIWDSLQSSQLKMRSSLAPEDTIAAWGRLHEAAQQAGQETFTALQHVHRSALEREEERGAISLASRRKALARIGLPEVRQFRQSRCDAEESAWRNELQAAQHIVPDLRALLMLRITKGES